MYFKYTIGSLYILLHIHTYQKIQTLEYRIKYKNIRTNIYTVITVSK